jgi:hypothetical protein
MGARGIALETLQAAAPRPVLGNAGAGGARAACRHTSFLLGLSGSAPFKVALLATVDLLGLPSRRGRAYALWRQAIVSAACPIALNTGTSSSERVSFRQINKKTRKMRRGASGCRRCSLGQLNVSIDHRVADATHDVHASTNKCSGRPQGQRRYERKRGINYCVSCSAGREPEPLAGQPLVGTRPLSVFSESPIEQSYLLALPGGYALTLSPSN